MQLKHLVLSLLATSSQAAVVGRPDLCGNEAPSEEFLQTLRDAAAEEASAEAAVSVKRDTTVVKTYVHIIAADSTRRGGAIDSDTIDAQMKVLNDDFSSTGYQFSLQNVSYTYDNQWSDISYSWNLYDLKSNLRKGDYGDLNIYYFRSITGSNGGGLTGYCNYPGNSSDASTYYNDGCNLHVETTPGGSFSPWNLGKITSHEVGHWFGLVHPWGDEDSGGCSGDGDFVADTPAQDRAVYGCDETSDTCPSVEGLDPVHNIMGYTDNSCVNQLTKGQAARMNTMFAKFRT